MKPSITKRLDELEQVLVLKRDPVFTVSLKDGTVDQCSYENAMSYFSSGKGNLVKTVSVDRPDYIETAGLIEMLCKS